MQQYFRTWFALSGLALLSGCANQLPPGGSGVYPESSVIRPPVVEESTASPAGSQPQLQPAATATQPSAVSSLITRAQQQRQTGDDEAALATLERALRISPRDGQLYYELALTHQALQQPAQAQQLAQRGLSLAQNPDTRQALKTLLSEL